MESSNNMNKEQKTKQQKQQPKKPVLIQHATNMAPPYGYQQNVISKLLRSNFRSTPSLLSVFPLIDGKGTVKSIPNHILGLDTNFDNVVKKINEYRNMATSEQENELLRYRKMKRFEKNMHSARIEALEVQKSSIRKHLVAEAQIIDNRSKQNRASRRKTTSDARAQQQENKTTAENTPTQKNEEGTTASNTTNPQNNNMATTASNTTNHHPPQKNNETIATKNSHKPVNKVVDEKPLFCFAPMTKLEHEFFHSPPPKRQRIAQLLEQNKPVAKDSIRTANQKVASSPVDARRKLGSSSVQRAPNKRVHHQGQHATTVRQQNDSRSRDDINFALQSVATAMDTCFYPSRMDNEPTVKMMFMILREVKTTGGGSVSVNDLRMKKPELIILTHSPQDLEPIMNAYEKTTIDMSGEFTLIPLKANSCNFVAPVVKSHIQNLVSSRKTPKAKELDPKEK